MQGLILGFPGMLLLPPPIARYYACAPNAFPRLPWCGRHWTTGANKGGGFTASCLCCVIVALLRYAWFGWKIEFTRTAVKALADMDKDERRLVLGDIPLDNNEPSESPATISLAAALGVWGKGTSIGNLAGVLHDFGRRATRVNNLMVGTLRNRTQAKPDPIWP